VQWQYSPLNTKLAKRRRAKRAAEAAPQEASTPTHHQNPSSLVRPTSRQPLLKPVSINLDSLAGKHFFTPSAGPGPSAADPDALQAAASQVAAAPAGTPRAATAEAVGTKIVTASATPAKAPAEGPAKTPAQAPAQAEMLQAPGAQELLDHSTPDTAAAKAQPTDMATVMASKGKLSGTPAATTQSQTDQTHSLPTYSMLSEATVAGQTASMAAVMGRQPKPMLLPVSTVAQTQQRHLIGEGSTAMGDSPSMQYQAPVSILEAGTASTAQVHAADSLQSSLAELAASKLSRRSPDTVSLGLFGTSPTAGQDDVAAAPALLRECSPNPVGKESRSGMTFAPPRSSGSPGSSRSPGLSRSADKRHSPMPNPFRVSPETLHVPPPPLTQCLPASAARSASPEVQLLSAPTLRQAFRGSSSASRPVQLLPASTARGASPEVQLLSATTLRQGITGSPSPSMYAQPLLATAQRSASPGLQLVAAPTLGESFGQATTPANTQVLPLPILAQRSASPELQLSAPTPKVEPREAAPPPTSMQAQALPASMLRSPSPEVHMQSSADISREDTPPNDKAADSPSPPQAQKQQQIQLDAPDAVREQGAIVASSVLSVDDQQSSQQRQQHVLTQIAQQEQLQLGVMPTQQDTSAAVTRDGQVCVAGSTQ